MRWAKAASGARLARSRLTNGATKTMLHQEWSMSIEAEAQAQVVHAHPGFQAGL
jgi:hypothetical protein